MIRLSLLQFRAQAITAAVTLAAFAVLLAATGPHLASTYAADGLGSCHGGSCANLAIYFTGSLATGPYGVLFLLSTGVILLAPAVIGLFWGAPLIARELETGTAAIPSETGAGGTTFTLLALSIPGQPASRYWPFQATETAIYLALALALAGYCFRRLRRLS